MEQTPTTPGTFPAAARTGNHRGQRERVFLAAVVVAAADLALVIYRGGMQPLPTASRPRTGHDRIVAAEGLGRSAPAVRRLRQDLGPGALQRKRCKEVGNDSACGGLHWRALDSGGGAVHLQRYATGYSAIPTIGTLFVRNAISAGVLGLGLLLPLHRALGPRRGNGAVGVLALAGVTIALGSLVALFISETGTLFGFSQDGYDTPIVIAIAVEVLATVLLTPLAAISVRRAVAKPAPRAQRPRRPAGYGVSRSA